jgi:competence protein ComEA
LTPRPPDAVDSDVPELGGWVPAVDHALVNHDLLSEWAPRAERGRHRTVEPDAPKSSGEWWAAAAADDAADDAAAEADEADEADDDGGEDDDSDGGEDNDNDIADGAGADDSRTWPHRSGDEDRPRGAEPTVVPASGAQPVADDEMPAAAGQLAGIDPEHLDGAEGEPQPVGVRARRINGRWGRFAELWVPESMREARVDPGRRGMLVLVLVAAVAAIVAAVGVWRDRPEPRPVETAVVAAGSGVVPATAASSAPSVGSSDAAAAAPASGSAAPAVTEILVSVTGLVANPGVVRLAPEARVADAIAAAGGTQPGADLTGMNLAAKLADGDSVVVTETGPAPAAPGPGTSGGSVGGSSGGSTQPAGGLVNLNTADEAALDTLPGVGPVMAQNILAWREANGKFATVEQLQEISGIGPARYAQLAPLVTVG